MRCLPKVTEGEPRLARSGQMLFCADSFQIGEGISIAAQHQVIAIIDHFPKLLIKPGSAAAARLRRSFENLNVHAATHKMHCCGKARQACADDIDAAFHHGKRPWRMPNHSSFDVAMRARRRGGNHPCDSIRLKRDE